MSVATHASVDERVDRLDWPAIAAGLDDLGCASTGPVLSADECRTLADLYAEDDSLPVDDRHGALPLRRG